jgi:hypothetical protein
MIERRINKKALSKSIFGAKLKFFLKSRQAFIDLIPRNFSKIMAIF